MSAPESRGTGVEGHLQAIKDAIWGKFIPTLMELTEAKVVENDCKISIIPLLVVGVTFKVYSD